MAGLEDTFAALSDPTRVAVIELLREGPQRAGEIADALNMSAPALSRHLRVLRESGLIADDGDADDARVRLFRLEATPFASMREWLDDVETFWDGQLQSFKRHAEKSSAAKRRRK